MARTNNDGLDDKDHVFRFYVSRKGNVTVDDVLSALIVDAKHSSIKSWLGSWNGHEPAIPAKSIEFCKQSEFGRTLLARAQKRVDAGRGTLSTTWDPMKGKKSDAKRVGTVRRRHAEHSIDDGDAAVPPLPEEVDDSIRFPEGATTRITINAYERNARARTSCIRHYGVSCTVCGFNFETVYGELGKGFIHVHHVRVIASIGEEYEVDPVTDLRPVCPNCHAMLHQRRPALPIDELRSIRQRRLT
jgi:hypothetical protein